MGFIGSAEWFVVCRDELEKRRTMARACHGPGKRHGREREKAKEKEKEPMEVGKLAGKRDLDPVMSSFLSWPYYAELSVCFWSHPSCHIEQ